MPRISYRTNTQNLASLEKLAIEKGKTVNALITEALREYAEKNNADWIEVKPGRQKREAGK